MSVGRLLSPGPVCPRAGLGLAVVLVCALGPAAFGQNEPGPTPPPKATEPPPQPSEEELVRLPQDHEYFKFVEDEGPFLNRGKPVADPALGTAAKMELKAYDFVLAHA